MTERKRQKAKSEKVTAEEKAKRMAEWRCLVIGRKFPHDNTARRING